MESSYITGTGDDGEGCNSCESGWTMYLASPGDDDYGGKGSGSDGSNVDDGYGYRYIAHGRKGGKEYHDDGDDNDSLASDASTGPAKVKAQPSSPDGKEAPGRGKHGATDDDDDKDGEKPKEEEGDTRTRFSTSSRKKAGNKAEKGGEGKSSKRGHGKKGSSSRTSFFW